MTQARLVIDLPEKLWVAEITRRHPEATVCVLSAVPVDGSGIALISIYAEEAGRIVREIENHRGIVDTVRVQESDNEAAVQIETRTPMLILSAQTSGVLIDYPVRIRDGRATLEVSGGHDGLASLIEEFERAGLEFRIEYIRDRERPDDLLTETQRELLLTAVECGYYDTPRECSLTDVAEQAGVAKSTCSETLQRAEAAVVRSFVEELTGPIELESGSLP
ncbi:MAG: helix-turn-helix domain-containing protein [Haloferacaceae archaeon]